MFYIKSYEYTKLPMDTIIVPKYIYSADEMETLRKNMLHQMDIIIRHAAAASEYERVLKVHDIMCANIRYVDDCVWDRHTAVGALLDKKAVCDGFSKAFKWIMDNMGIECRIVTGKWTINGKETTHAWNIVEMDGRWRHVDVTYDANDNWRNNRNHDYFSLTDEQIARDHVFDMDKYPKADGDRNDYYTTHGLLMIDKKMLQDYALMQVGNGIRDITVKLPDEIPDDVAEQKISEVLSHLPIPGNGVSGIDLRSNIKQHIFQIRFS